MSVGDHEADVPFARNQQASLGQKSKVTSVAAAYSGADPSFWGAQPEFIIQSPIDLVSVCQGITRNR